MYEGKIIKFYREKANLTQEQLGRGICSDTHISKIERGMTEYAPEVITLLANRLNIQMDREIATLQNIKKRLHHWHTMIIMQLFQEMDDLKNELEQEQLIHISEYDFLYKLLQARYELMYDRTESAHAIIKEVQKNSIKLPLYESNLLKHVWGIYYLSQQDYPHTIQMLRQIKDEEYNNPEYYYCLAVAYHFTGSRILSYYCGEKSRAFFRQANIFLRVIDAENLMLVQLRDKNHLNFEEGVDQFEKLIQTCDLCNAPDRKSKVLHNLAYEHLRKGNHEQASRYYKESMDLKEKNKQSGEYLISLDGYIRSCLEGNLLPCDELLHLVQEGLAISTEIHNYLHTHTFTLLLHSVKGQDREYHHYLQETALPFFREYGHAFLIERSEKELFNYYSKTGQIEQALKIADALINKED